MTKRTDGVSNTNRFFTIKSGTVAAMLTSENVLRALFCIAVVHAVAVLLMGLNQPLLDMHHFRQTQTALTSYWILKGGPWIAYETPVVGAPWAIPFEFPLYQLLASALAAAGMPLNAAGRVIAFGFFLGSLWPLRILFAELQLGRASFLSTSIFFLCCPLYLYWSRTFLVETCALFFALLWLALIVRYYNCENWQTAAAAVAAGCLAALAKSTTLPSFAVLGCVIAAAALIREYYRGEPKQKVLRLAVAAAVLIGVPFVIGFAWVAYSDAIKTANEFGRLLTSTAVSRFTFGTFQQRLSSQLWFETVLMRAIPDTLGIFYLAGFASLGATVTSVRSLLATTAAIVGFTLPFLVFTNLHIVHNYYQAANAIFLLAAVGLGVGRIFDLRSSMRAVALLFMAIVVASQLSFFYARFLSWITNDYSQLRMLRISEIAKTETQPGQSLIVIGDDWASTVPYHAERKALVIPPWSPTPLVERALAEPQRFLGDQLLGGIIYCSDKLPPYGTSIPIVKAFVEGRRVLGEFDGCQLLAAHR